MVRLIALLFISLLLLAGCASGGPLGSALDDLSQLTRDDATAALKMTEKATDAGAPYRADCYKALLKWLPEKAAAPTPAPEAKGLLSLYEIAAEADARLTSGQPLIPVEVRARCDYVVRSIERAGLRIGAKGAPFPGVGALSDILK